MEFNPEILMQYANECLEKKVLYIKLSCNIDYNISYDNRRRINKYFLEFIAVSSESTRRRLMVKEFKIKLYRDMNRIMCHQYIRKNSLQMKVFTKAGSKFNYE